MERFGFLNVVALALKAASPFALIARLERERRLRALAREAVAWRDRLIAGSEHNAAFVSWVMHSADHLRVWIELIAFDEELALFVESPKGRRILRAAPSRSLRWYGIARIWPALVVVACLAIAVAWSTWRGGSYASSGLIVTQIGEQRKKVLKDGTVLHLNTASNLRWSITASERVLTLLAGEVLVDPGDDARPLTVYRDGVLIRGYGSRFLVRARSDSTEVTVLDGSVYVAAADPGAGLGVLAESTPHSNLRKGQSGLVMAGEEGDVRARLLSTQEMDGRLAWLNGRLQFQKQTLGEIADEFNRYNTRKLQIKGACLRSAQISGTFKWNDEQDFIDSLFAWGLRASVRTVADSEEVVIEGNCAPRKKPDGVATVVRPGEDGAEVG